MADKEKIKEFIDKFEREYFTGPYSESSIKADLESRRAMDGLSTMGSSGRQTNRLGEKRSIYIKEFNDLLDSTINPILEWAKTNCSDDTVFISSCENCKTQVNRMLDIVRNF